MDSILSGSDDVARHFHHVRGYINGAPDVAMHWNSDRIRQKTDVMVHC